MLDTPLLCRTWQPHSGCVANNHSSSQAMHNPAALPGTHRPQLQCRPKPQRRIGSSSSGTGCRRTRRRAGSTPQTAQHPPSPGRGAACRAPLEPSGGGSRLCQACPKLSRQSGGTPVPPGGRRPAPLAPHAALCRACCDAAPWLPAAGQPRRAGTPAPGCASGGGWRRQSAWRRLRHWAPSRC